MRRGAQVAEECLEKANDLSGLLLLHSAHGSAAGLSALVGKAEAAGRLNVAFLCQLLAGRLDACVDLLLAAGRIPEAAFFARTYLPSRISEARRPSHTKPVLGVRPAPALLPQTSVCATSPLWCRAVVL